MALPALLSVARPAFAQSAADKAAAEVLYDEGVKLLTAGDLAQACPKFAESLRLDTGIGTMLYLAECYERQGKTASAWAQFREAQASAGAKEGDNRGRVAKERADRLEPKLSKLLVVVPPEAAIDGLVVTRDGTAIGRALWGTETPIDPGAHVIRVSAPGRIARDLTVDVKGEAAHEKIVIEPLALAPPAPTPPPTSSSPVDADASHRGSTQRTVGVVLGAAGLVGLAVGTVFGVRAISTKSDSEPHCDATSCDQQGLDLRSDAHAQGDVSTVFLVAGGVLAATGIVLWLTAPRASAPSQGTSTRTRFVVVPARIGAGGGAAAALRF